MEQIRMHFSKLGYGSIFCVFLPILLVLWSHYTASFITLSVPDFPIFGLLIAVFGLILMLLSMYDLWKKGKGLPMNAFPPKKYVQSGMYFYFHHPIYVGVVLVSFGVSLFVQSSSGFWLVSPVFLLLIVAYVIGFEHELISNVFHAKSHKTFFDFPEPNNQNLTLKNRLLIFVWIYLPWFICYELFIFVGIPKDAIDTTILLDSWIPFIDSSVLFYVLIYPLALILPFILTTNKVAKQFIFDMISGMLLIFFCYLVFPFMVHYDSIDSNSFFSECIILGRNADGQVAALPSFHVFWAVLLYRYFGYGFPKFKLVFGLVSSLIIISCLTTKNHTILDVLCGILSYILVINREEIYKKMLLFFEKISNQWKEWNIGNIRIIHHGLYAAIGAFFGFFLMASFGTMNVLVVYAIGISGFVGAGIWAQCIEGSSSLLRPFGYYGSVLGIAITVLAIACFTDIDFWFLTGIASLAACIIQSFGRLRCLVQGCCHGKPTESCSGIRFNNPKSRVHKMANLQGITLFPTQVYSIFSNVLIFLLLLRFYHLQLPASFSVGMYLILNGSFRFVEESLRGEPQTAYWYGMRLYQWLAIVSIVFGILCTCFPSESLPKMHFDSSIFIHSFVYSIIVLFVYGIDFPKSKVRFSRLTQD